MCQSSSVGAMVVCKRILIGVATSFPHGTDQGGHLVDGADDVVEVTSGHRFPHELSRARQPVVPQPVNIGRKVSQQTRRGLGGHLPVAGIPAQPSRERSSPKAFCLWPKARRAIVNRRVVHYCVDRYAATTSMRFGDIKQ